MKKCLLSILLVSVILFALVGCHGTPAKVSFVVPENFDTEKQHEITFWAKNDTNITQVNIYNKAIADFEALYPNIKVNLRLYTDYGKLYNDVITNISTDTTPNVCITYPDHIATYLTGKNSVVPLDELFSDEKYGLGGSELRFDSTAAGEIIPKFLEECAFDGHHYAIPFMRSTEACYVNRTFVEALGYELPEKLTWDFVWEVSDAAAAKDEEGTYLLNGQKVMLPFLYKSTDNMMIQLLRQQDAGYSTADGEILIFNDVTRKELNTIADHVHSGAFSTFKISSYPANFLNAGQCVFAVDSTAGATWMGCNAPNMDISADKLQQFEIEVMEIPQYDVENPRMISQGPSVCVFNKRDHQQVLASWLFAQFLLTNDVQIAYSQTEGYAPVTSKAQQSDEYQDYLSRIGEDNQLHYDVKIKATKLLMDNTDNTFVTPVFNGSASLRDAAGQMIENVTKSVRRKQNVDDEYIANLFAEMTALHHLDGQQGTDRELGPMPAGSIALLFGLLAVWLFLGSYVLVHYFKRRKKAK